MHLDAFTGNMLAEGPEITAVLDIGYSSLAGDRRLDPLSAAAYLASRQITPEANAHDVEAAMSWLASAGLLDAYEPARRWLAAYWAFAAPSDLAVSAWCAQVLCSTSRTS